MKTEAEAMGIIGQALLQTIKHEVAFDRDTDLADGILDSLDGIAFAMEVESLAQKQFPEDIDLVEAGYFKVANLIAFLTG